MKPTINKLAGYHCVSVEFIREEASYAWPVFHYTFKIVLWDREVVWEWTR